MFRRAIVYSHPGPLGHFQPILNRVSFWKRNNITKLWCTLDYVDGLVTKIWEIGVLRIFEGATVKQITIITFSCFRALGQGAFGEVYKGYILGFPNMEREMPVAVKVARFASCLLFWLSAIQSYPLCTWFKVIRP